MVASMRVKSHLITKMLMEINFCCKNVFLYVYVFARTNSSVFHAKFGPFLLIKISRHNLCSADKALAYQMDSETIPALRPLVIWRVAASLLGCDIHVLLMENPQGDTTTQLSHGSQKHWSWEGQRLSFKGEIPSEGRISLGVSHAGTLQLAWQLLRQPSPSSLQQPLHRHNQDSSSGAKES